MATLKHWDSQKAVFGVVMLIALAWAFTTQHVWEDYYITYRTSKNLATGYGLVFNHGDRLHTFTSPLGVLLPAAASYVTGTKSDTAAIWVFRIWSAAAFAGAAVLILALARRFDYGTFATLALIVFLALDGKSIDFTTNGMETGFLLLFIAYTLWAMFVCNGRRWLHLGCAWGGLMWTRPDSFLYVGLLAAGVFFFNDPQRTGLTRWAWLKLFLQAGLVCTAIYLPWIEWSWAYFGTPVPHTITAKGGITTESKTILGALKTFIDFPLTVWRGSTSLEATFLPSYFQIGGWPAAAVTTARWVALLLAFQWVLPLWRLEVRVASFAFCGMHVYLTYFPFFPFPWYLPGTAFLAAITLGGMIAQLLVVARSGWLRATVVTIAVMGMAGEGWLTWQMRREMATEQTYSATGTRRKVGEWLKANARPGDTVFMEPLGHIGYFSGLKTYDFPGLSSREMVGAIHAVGTNWAYLINYLSPDWVVFRPREYARVKDSMPTLFGPGNAYELVNEINNLPQIGELTFYGRGYVEFDAHLLIFHRQQAKPRNAPKGPYPLETLGLPAVEIGRQQLFNLPGNAVTCVPLPAGAKRLLIMYAIPPAADGTVPDGDVEFAVFLRWPDGHNSERMQTHRLQPKLNPKDRGVMVCDVRLPQIGPGAMIVLMTTAKSGSPIESAWGEPEFIK